MISTYVNPLALQMGILTPDGLYRMYRDLGNAVGQNANQYITQPSPEASQMRISAEEAIAVIQSGFHPQGIPLEGATAHLEKLSDFIEDDEFMANLDPSYRDALVEWIQEMTARAEQEQQMEAAAQAAAQAQQGAGLQNIPANAPPDMSQPPLQEGELIDESLPSAGGGGSIV
jgi:hypothetical protein